MKSMLSHKRRSDSRGGFTLMEVLLVTILSAVLMIGLWSLFSTYIRLFESGPRRTERAQLLRALKQQITDDLRGSLQAAQPNPSPTGVQPLSNDIASGSSSSSSDLSNSTVPELNMTGESTSSALPRFGIVGTSRSLTIVTYQIPTDRVAVIPTEDQAVDLTETETAAAPELRVVVYSFQEHEEPGMSDFQQGPPPGLLRRDLDWQEAMAHPELLVAAEDDFMSSQPEIDPLELQSDESLTWVPEVKRLEIRYFGNGSWRNSWDSYQEKTLPTVIEVGLELIDPEELEEEKDEEELAPLDDPPSLTDEIELNNEVESVMVDPLRENKPEYRFLIHLPGGLTKERRSGIGLPPPTDDYSDSGGGF